MQEVSQSHVLADYIRQSPKLLVYYGASWCGPCKKFLPIVSKFASSGRMGIKCIKVDVDHFDNELNIRSVPTVELYRNGNLVSTGTGVQNEESFTAWMMQNFAVGL